MTTAWPAAQSRPLSNRDRGHLALALREQRQFRLEQLAELQRVDSGDLLGGAEVRTALAQAATHALTEIEAALVRLGSGTYGACLACRQPIARERLAVLPAVALCMACQRSADANSERPRATVGRRA